MDVLSNNLSSVSGAVSVGFSLIYQIAKNVGYQNIFKSVKNIFDKRSDSEVVKTFVARPLGLLVNLEKITQLDFLSNHKTQMEIISKEVKGYASVFSVLPVPIFKLINLIGGGVAEFPSKAKSLFFHKESGIQSRLLDLAGFIKFSKSFSEGFSFLSSKISSSVSLEKYSPMSSKLITWIVNDKSACLAFAINSFCTFKKVYTEGVDPVKKVVDNLRQGMELDGDQKALALNILKGVDSFSAASIYLVNVFQEKLGKHRAFEIFRLVMAGVGMGVSMAAVSMVEAPVVEKGRRA